MCVTPAFARQRQAGAQFPSKLRDAVDKSAISKGTIYPSKSTRQSERPRINTQKPPNREESQTPKQLDAKKPFKNASFSKNGRATSQANKWEGKYSSANPAPFRAITPFPRSRKSSTHPTDNNLDQAFEFGTVMTFPAEPASNHSDASYDTQPKKMNSNVYRAPDSGGIKVRFSSATIQPKDRSILEQHTAVSADRNTNQISEQVIQTSVVGPRFLIQDKPDLFEIEVSNVSEETATNVIVQMKCSEHLTITDFDRHAWLDHENRFVSWRLDSLQAGYKDVIRFRAFSATPGNHEQEVTIGMNNQLQGQTGFITNVIQAPQTQKLPRPDFQK